MKKHKKQKSSTRKRDFSDFSFYFISRALIAIKNENDRAVNGVTRAKKSPAGESLKNINLIYFFTFLKLFSVLTIATCAALSTCHYFFCNPRLATLFLSTTTKISQNCPRRFCLQLSIIRLNSPFFSLSHSLTVCG